jgi:hypothetical protein
MPKVLVLEEAGRDRALTSHSALPPPTRAVLLLGDTSQPGARSACRASYPPTPDRLVAERSSPGLARVADVHGALGGMRLDRRRTLHTA